MTSLKNNSDSLFERILTGIKRLKHLPRVFSMVYKASKTWTFLWIIVLALRGILPVAVVHLTRILVDRLVLVSKSYHTFYDARSLLFPAVFMVAVILLSEILSGLEALFRRQQSFLIQDYILNTIYRQSSRIDLSFYDTSDYYNRLHRARKEAWFRPGRLVESMGAIFQSTITLFAMSALLFEFGVAIPLVLILSTLPVFIVVLKNADMHHKWHLYSTENDRKTWYYDEQLTSEKSAGEIRLQGLAGYFINRFKDVRSTLRNQRFNLLKKQTTGEILAALLSYGAAAACMGFAVFQMLGGIITFGDLALFLSAFTKGQKVLKALLGNVGDVYRNILFLSDLFLFLEIKPEIKNAKKLKDIPETIHKGIEVKDVTFKYPGQNKDVLKKFNAFFPANNITAIVGPNGSGKSTLVRLIARLYDPQSGNVLIDGENIINFDISLLREFITVLFQEPVRYSATLYQNIRYGKLSKKDDPDSVKKAACESGADVLACKFDSGYETLLGKWFENGMELSVGEWKKVALARAFYKKTGVIILDEPTGAMDSWAESKWMENLKKVAHGKIVIIITHRFSTAMHAKNIYVMQNGKIIESGSHEKLKNLKGYYFEALKAKGEI